MGIALRARPLRPILPAMKALGKALLFALCLAFPLGWALWAQGPPPDALAPKALPRDAHHPRLADELVLLARAQVGDALRVLVEPTPGTSGAALAARLRARGIAVEARSTSLVRVRVRPERLEELAGLEGVGYVRRARRYRLARFPTSQALTPLGATLWHGLGLQGQGIKVAVIDVGFGSLAFAQEVGALPAEVIADFTDYSGLGAALGNHGTAVAQIVHETAPQARLYLKQVGDELDLENAVEDAIRQGVQIINHSVGWTNAGFGDGTGFFAGLVRRAHEAGILWVNAAGNHAQSHWTGRFLDANANGWADFPGAGEEALRIPAYFGGLISLSLTWDDWPRTDQDLDLYLYDGEGNVVAFSTGWQLGAEPPVEALDYFVEATDVYRVKVLARRASKPLRIKIFSDSSHPLKPAVPHGSLLAPADAPEALAVGAVSIRRWEAGPQEPFSSLGPTSDGRIKPDLVGPDGTANLLINPFGGTSAAAPHVAGAAALLWSRHPDWNADQVRAALEAGARDLGRPGKDVVYGAGALDLSGVRPRAERRLSASRVRAGQTLEVTITVTLPALAFGALELQETLPRGWTLTSDDPAFDPGQNAWHWPLLGPGAQVEARYRLHVPAEAPPGRYRLRGLVNGVSVAGEERLEVLPAPASAARAAPTLERRPGALVARGAGGLRLEVYDLAGRLVFAAHSEAPALRWTGLTRSGGTAANGVYFVRVTAAGPPPQTRIFPVVWLR